MAEILTAEEFNRVKAKVKAEMSRRNATEHNASMAGYAGSEWDFSDPPGDGTPVSDEHVQKILDPLLGANDFLADNSLRAGKSGMEIELKKAENFVDRLASIDKTASETGCRGNCTGLCKDACTGGCQSGCGSSCGSGCNTGCTHTCGSGCTTSMKY